MALVRVKSFGFICSRPSSVRVVVRGWTWFRFVCGSKSDKFGPLVRVSSIFFDVIPRYSISFVFMHELSTTHIWIRLERVIRN